MEYQTYRFIGTDIIKGVWQEITLETGGIYSYGDFEQYEGEITEALQKNLFILPPLLSGSDYSGGSVQLSNFKVFLEDFKNVEGVYELKGGHGTYAVAIRFDVYHSNKEINEILSKLEDYLLIDEDSHSNLEYEWEQRFMDDSLIHDVIKEIDLEEYLIDNETITEDEDKIKQFIWEGIEHLNLSWSYEYQSAYIDATDTIPYVEDMLLLEYCTDLPMMAGREWSCDYIKEKYIEKCYNK